MESSKQSEAQTTWSTSIASVYQLDSVLSPIVDTDEIKSGNEFATTKRRLLMIVPSVTTGGADKFTLDLATQLSERDWEITVVATLPGDNSWVPQLAQVTSDIHILHDLLGPSEYPDFFRCIIESRRPHTILVSNSLFAYRALPYLRRLAQRIAIVDYGHAVQPVWLNGGYPRLSIEQKDHLDLQITSSEYLKRWMVQRGCDPGRVEVCYTNAEVASADAATFDSAARNRTAERLRTELALPDDVPIIIYPCRIDVEKQPYVFAKTVLELRRRGHRFSALVVGDGPYLRWLERFVKRRGLEKNVRFLGRQPNDEVRRLISFSDCIFLPSKFEGISLAIFEAMAEGVAVVGADVGGQVELVTPECGVLLERGDEETEVARYSQALGDLLDDPGKRRAMGEAGQQRIRDHFLLNAMGAKMDTLLEHARELALDSRRSMPTEDHARTAVLEAIREATWALPGAPPIAGDSLPMHVRWWLFRLAGAIGMPIHRLAIRLGFRSIEQVRQRAAKLLLPKAS
jgi:glycosyltransferase involved in cell wall biosynthesis